MMNICTESYNTLYTLLSILYTFFGGSMKLFVDSANVNEIKEIVDLGLCDGVTTNPTLVSKEGKDFMKTIEGVVKLVKGPVHVEPIAVDAEGIIKEALEFGKI